MTDAQVEALILAFLRSLAEEESDRIASDNSKEEIQE
ncbi:MAG: hypothetical protein RJB38_2322 [Pseudomonadota bacterium]|jgi:hypothetical protein